MMPALLVMLACRADAPVTTEIRAPVMEDPQELEAAPPHRTRAEQARDHLMITTALYGILGGTLAFSWLVSSGVGVFCCWVTPPLMCVVGSLTTTVLPWVGSYVLPQSVLPALGDRRRAMFAAFVAGSFVVSALLPPVPSMVLAAVLVGLTLQFAVRPLPSDPLLAELVDYGIPGMLFFGAPLAGALVVMALQLAVFVAQWLVLYLLGLPWMRALEEPA